MTEDELRERYRNEGWGILAEKAGFPDLLNVETSARRAFEFCWERLQKAEQLMEQMADHEGAEGFSSNLSEELNNYDPITKRD